MDGLAAGTATPKTVMIDATYLKAHRTAINLQSNQRIVDQMGRLIGHKRGSMNTNLHAVTDTGGRPIRFFMSAGQVSDYACSACRQRTGFCQTGAKTPTGSEMH